MFTFRRKKAEQNAVDELGLQNEAMQVFRGTAGLVFELCNSILRDIRNDLKMDNQPMNDEMIVIYYETDPNTKR